MKKTKTVAGLHSEKNYILIEKTKLIQRETAEKNDYTNQF